MTTLPHVTWAPTTRHLQAQLRQPPRRQPIHQLLILLRPPVAGHRHIRHSALLHLHAEPLALTDWGTQPVPLFMTTLLGVVRWHLLTSVMRTPTHWPSTELQPPRLLGPLQRRVIATGRQSLFVICLANATCLSGIHVTFHRGILAVSLSLCLEEQMHQSAM